MLQDKDLYQFNILYYPGLNRKTDRTCFSAKWNSGNEKYVKS